MEDAPLFHDVADGPAGGQAFWLRTSDGLRIRVGHWPCAEGEAVRGTVLLFPGRTEYIEKYGRAAADLAARGYDTLTIDWRGQGLADRLLTDRRVGHVGRFTDYQKDVAAMVAAADALDVPRPLFLLAHSMGGCIGLRALMEGVPVAACAFTGPMWGIQMASATRPAAWALSWSAPRLGFGHHLAPGTKPETYVLAEPFDDNTLTRDRDMYLYMQRQLTTHPDLSLGGPSLRWLNEALVEMAHLSRRPPPSQPCLTFLGTQERIVCPERIEARMAGWHGGQLREVQGGEHEVMMDTPATRAMVFNGVAAHFAENPEGANRQSA
ncbi:MAG: alpha/beta hydrolase [Rhodobacterales bacterium]|nr:alpha/beta hydrolase [Rhodobacterales bacterium]MDX5414639.1 alpha/beta hydrolase [Rhodobacterales bacterium]